MPKLHYANKKRWNRTQTPWHRQLQMSNTLSTSSGNNHRSSTPLISNETSASIQNGRIAGVSQIDDRTVQLQLQVCTGTNDTNGRQGKECPHALSEQSMGNHNNQTNSISQAPHHQPPMNDSSLPFTASPHPPPVLAAAAGVPNLRRMSDELIYVKLGNKTVHDAFELENPDNPGEHDTVWVEWNSSGKKACIYRHQIVKGGLGPRKRQRPATFSLLE